MHNGEGGEHPDTKAHITLTRRKGGKWKKWGPTFANRDVFAYTREIFRAAPNCLADFEAGPPPTAVPYPKREKRGEDIRTQKSGQSREA